MTEKKLDHKPEKPPEEKVLFLRSLPIEVKQSLSREEVNAFLYTDEWPDSLYRKLKDFLIEE